MYLSSPSFWRTSQMNCVLTLPCTWIKSCSSCLCLNRPVEGVCARCRSSSKPPSVLQESSSFARVMLCRPSTLSAQAPWKCSRTTLCWLYWVRLHTNSKVQKIISGNWAFLLVILMGKCFPIYHTHTLKLYIAFQTSFKHYGGWHTNWLQFHLVLLKWPTFY